MAKKQDVTVVADYQARAKFVVSGEEKIVTGKIVSKAVPSTGFELEVVYKDMKEVLEYAVPTTIIGTQAFLRDYYRAHGRFPVAPSTRLKVSASGAFEVPPTVHLDRLEAQVRAGGEISLADKVRLAKIAGLPVPPEWLEELVGETIAEPIIPTTTIGVTQSDEVLDDDEDEEEELKYKREQLERLPERKIKAIAQDEQLDDYADRTKEDLIDELCEIEKA